MRKRVLMFVAGLIMLCLMSVPVAAKGMPDLKRTGSITVSLRDGEKKINGTFAFHQVGNIVLQEGKYQFSLVDAFAGCGESLEQIDSPELAKRLWEFAQKQNISGKTLDTTDGNVYYEIPEKKLGLYLVVQTSGEKEYQLQPPFLVSVPFEVDGTYIYDIMAKPKVAPSPNPGPGPGPNPGPNPDPNPEPNPDPNPEPNPDPNPGPNPEPNPNPNPGPDNGTHGGHTHKPGKKPENTTENTPDKDETSKKDEQITDTEHQTTEKNEQITNTEYEITDRDDTTEHEDTSTLRFDFQEKEETSTTTPRIPTKKLPQTGQAKWPVQVLAVLGVFLIGSGLVQYCRLKDEKKKLR